MTGRRRVRVTAALAAGVLSAAVTAGCAGAEPSVVAYVGGVEISERQLASAEQGVKVALPDQIIPPQAIINVLIQGVIAEQTASANNIAITDAQREALTAAGNLAPLLGVPEARPVAFDVADQQITAEQIGPERYLAAIAATPVTLNPRYGVLDPQQKVIATDASGSLAAPVPTPAAPQ